MLAIIDPGKPWAVSGYVVDAALARLARAALACHPLGPEMTAVVADMGFDGFTYAKSADPGPLRRDSRCFAWSTLPREWVARYGERGYAERDPALIRSWDRSLPLVWDAADYGGDARYSDYLAEARRVGIASGVSISFRDRDRGRIYVALNSRISPVPVERKRGIARRLGDIVLLALAFHDCFMARLVDRAAGKQGEAPDDRQLSPREAQCLELAAKGMTSVDIGIKLGITPRTANFHFRNIVSKLDALNRHEAIALGIERGLIRPDHPSHSSVFDGGKKRGKIAWNRSLHAQPAVLQRMREGNAAGVQKHPS